MHTETLSITARDGAGIRTIVATPQRNIAQDDTPRGLVIISHGFGEHSGSYAELLEHLTGGGYAAVIFDQRGHGEMDEPDAKKRAKRLGIVPHYQQLLDDIGSVAEKMQERFPTLPLALYGHSMGGHLAINYLLRTAKHPFSCVILESPWLGLHKPVSPLLSGLARLLGGISPQIAIINRLNHADITSEPKSLDSLRRDRLYHNRISMRLFAGIDAGCRYALANAERLFLPTYLAYAEQERIVSNAAIENFAWDCGENLHLHPYASRHAIHSDTARAQYYADILDFLAENCI